MELKKYFPKIVSTKKDREIVLKIPERSSYKEMQRYMNALIKEDVPILRNEKVTLEDEEKYIIDLLKQIKSGECITIHAFYKSKLVGSVGVKKGKFRESHVGSLGISVSKNFRNEGLGSILLKEILFLSKNYLSIKIVKLTVMRNNVNALRLYKKVGFKACGKIPKAIYYQGKYEDEEIMFLKI